MNAKEKLSFIWKGRVVIQTLIKGESTLKGQQNNKLIILISWLDVHVNSTSRRTVKTRKALRSVDMVEISKRTVEGSKVGSCFPTRFRAHFAPSSHTSFCMKMKSFVFLNASERNLASTRWAFASANWALVLVSSDCLDSRSALTSSNKRLARLRLFWAWTSSLRGTLLCCSSFILFARLIEETVIRMKTCFLEKKKEVSRDDETGKVAYPWDKVKKTSRSC